MQSFVELQSDKIVNVRLMLSETLAYLFEKNEIMLETTNDDANELDLPRSNSLGPV